MATISYATLKAFISNKVSCDRHKRNGFFAILLECSSIDRAQSGSRDYYCKCKLIDQSVLEDHSDGIECMVFSSRSEALPITAGERGLNPGSSNLWLNLELAKTCLTPGDIVRFHSVYKTEYRGKPQLVAMLDKGASCCLFTRDLNHSSKPYWISAQGLQPREGHDERLENMRGFVPLLQKIYRTSHKLQSYQRSICDFEDGLFLDLFCQILLVDRSQEPWVLWVWDGTDAEPQDINSDPEIELESQESFDLYTLSVG